MGTLFQLLLRIFLLAAGLVFAASLALAFVVLLLLWALRSLWARVTGRPVAPFVMRMDPRGGFVRVYRGQSRSAAPVAPAEADRPFQREIGDVTDVEVKEPRRPT